MAKSLIAVHAETVAHIASLTRTGDAFFEQSAPIERVLSSAREAGQIGKRLTIQDIQSKEQLEPSDVSKAVGTLKKEGAILIVQGGASKVPVATAPPRKPYEPLLQELRGGPRDLTFVEPRAVASAACSQARQCREPFRVDERVTRSFVLTAAGRRSLSSCLETAWRRKSRG